MWGDPSSAARDWYDRSPDSVRAATIWAGYQMSETGIESGLITLRDFVGRHPEHGYLLIQDLRIACLIAPEKDYRDRVVLLNGVLGSVNYTLTAGTMLSELSTTARQLGCNGVDSESVRSIAESLRQNRRYANDKTYNHFHHKLMASIYRHEENTLMTLEHLENANEIFSSEEIDMMIVTTLASDGYYDAARSAIAEALEHRPIHPVKRYLQARDMTELGHYVDALEKRADQNNSPQSDTGTPTT